MLVFLERFFSFNGKHDFTISVVTGKQDDEQLFMSPKR